MQPMPAVQPHAVSFLHGESTHQIHHAVLHAQEVRVGIHVMINLSICQLQDCSPLETADEVSSSQVLTRQSEVFLIMELQAWAQMCHTASSGHHARTAGHAGQQGTTCRQALYLRTRHGKNVTNLAWLQKVDEGVVQIPLHLQLQLINKTPPAARRPEHLTRSATEVALWVHLPWQGQLVKEWA